MSRVYKLIISSVVFGLSATSMAAELPPVNKVIDTAKNINQEIQNKINTSPVTQEINQALPTKEQTAGFLAGAWKIIWAIVKFIAGIFDWILNIVVEVFSTVLSKIGLGFLGSQ